MGTHYSSRTYRVIWTAVEIHKRMGGVATDKDERLALRFSTMLLLFLALESYLNHVGERIASEVWADERNYFNGRNLLGGQRYLGSIGKYEYLQTQCRIPEGSVSTEKATLKELKDFRNMLAHGKTEEGVTSYSCKIGDPLEPHLPEIWALINSDLLERSLPAVKFLMCHLHAAALVVFPDSSLEPSPFTGPPFSQITDIVREPKA